MLTLTLAATLATLPPVVIGQTQTEQVPAPAVYRPLQLIRPSLAPPFRPPALDDDAPATSLPSPGHTLVPPADRPRRMLPVAEQPRRLEEPPRTIPRIQEPTGPIIDEISRGILVPLLPWRDRPLPPAAGGDVTPSRGGPAGDNGSAQTPGMGALNTLPGPGPTTLPGPPLAGPWPR